MKLHKIGCFQKFRKLLMFASKKRYMHNSTIFRKVITTEEKVLELVNKANGSENNCLITYLNQHCYNIYSTDKAYKNLIDNHFNTYIDGIGIYLALRLLGYNVVKRFNATDLNEKIFRLLAQKSSKAYIIGGNYSNSIINKFKTGGIDVIGYQNGFFDKKETKELISNINKTNPDTVIIGMGVPKQEYLAEQITKEISGKLIICVGNFLEFYLGNIKRIPGMFRNIGLEWIFRMFTEPKRLCKRYIVGIPVFFFLIMKEYMAGDN